MDQCRDVGKAGIGLPPRYAVVTAPYCLLIDLSLCGVRQRHVAGGVGVQAQRAS